MNYYRSARSLFYGAFRGFLCVICSLVAFAFCQMIWRYDTGLLRAWGPPLRVAGVESCPACYGLDSCSALTSGDVDYYCPKFTTISIMSIFGVKNVYFACSQSYGDIVMKKLGHDWQLHQLDMRICDALGQSEDCDFNGLTDPSFSIRDKIASLVEYKEGLVGSEEFGLTLCPNTKHVDKLTSSFLLDENENSILNSILLANVWTILNINPEPIIMKYINNSTQGWPVPTYLGACGRTTLQSYNGEMIGKFMSEPWLKRARLAVNLLKAADVFTFNHTDFRFYLTDISLENIVMSKDRMWHPIFVDLENVVVVDKHVRVENQPEGWTSNHTSETIECNNCFAFSTENVCRHHVSDHNHYAMCKFIEESILHSVPESVLKVSPNVMDLLQRCVSPSDDGDRFSAAQILMDELEFVIEECE